jgi:hypothetical protein
VKWVSLLLCLALGLPCLLAGCAAADIAGMLFLRSNAATGERVLAGSLDEVATSTRESLTNLGFKADLSSGKDAYYIKSETRDGQRFRIVLTRVRTASGEKTRVVVEWEGNRQESVTAQVLTEVERTHGSK